MSTFPIFAPGFEEQAPLPDNTYRWATVTDTSPLRVRLDGDTEGLPVTPDSLINPSALTIGARVWVQLFGRRLIVLGKALGGSVEAPWESSTIGSEAGFAYATSFTYASDAVDDPPQIIAKGEHVTIAGRIKSTISRSSGSTIVGFTIPERFWPVWNDPYARRVHPHTTVMNGGSAIGPVIRAEIVAFNGNCDLFMFNGQTPTWTSGTWITIYGTWLRRYPFVAP